MYETIVQWKMFPSYEKKMDDLVISNSPVMSIVEIEEENPPNLIKQLCGEEL